jgi:hypothetical protein
MKVGVDVGISVGVLVAVGTGVSGGCKTNVWVAAAPAVWAMMVFNEKGSKVGGVVGGETGPQAVSRARRMIHK